MAKLTLKFGDHVLKEVAIGPHGVRIGRLPDNNIAIDNPAVSSHHARVIPEGEEFVVEDLKSTNGTYINDTRITRQTLADGDVMTIGKHHIAFDKFGGADVVADAETQEEPEDMGGGTVYLDTKKQRELLAKMGLPTQSSGRGGDTVVHGAGHTPAPAAAAKPRVGILRVLAGSADKPEYSLDAHTSLIGKQDGAAIPLKGWFKPAVAVSISRKGETYVATKLGGTPTVNNQPLSRHELKEGDVIQVSGLSLEFGLK